MLMTADEGGGGSQCQQMAKNAWQIPDFQVEKFAITCQKLIIT